MTPINVLKELEVPGTPLFLFDCTLPTGDVQHWSTHNVTVNGQQYLSRVLKHNHLRSELQSGSCDGRRLDRLHHACECGLVSFLD